MPKAQPPAYAPVSLTVVILTRDEALHVGRAIESVSSLASRIIVVDSGSEDETRDIARSHGGDITLGDSPMGGLRATVRVPS